MAKPKKILESADKNSVDFELIPENNVRLMQLGGRCNVHFNQIEKNLKIKIYQRSNRFRLVGSSESVKCAQDVIISLYDISADTLITTRHVHLMLTKSRRAHEINNSSSSDYAFIPDEKSDDGSISLYKQNIRGYNDNQRSYIKKIQQYDFNFGVGPAGTGKTFLAVACAVNALMRKDVERIVLIRPAIEAGERLGFLPGDIEQKIDPYVRPLFDALYEILGVDKVHRMMSKGLIELAPLAYMRGRTLNAAFAILDEAQNTTAEQMKMFLTRIGFESKVVITGDETQIDLPAGKISGLSHALKILSSINEIGVQLFSSKDIVRHPVVQKIVDAYSRDLESSHGS